MPFLLLPASPAAARDGCEAPPGTAAVEQYCETLPSAGGLTDATRSHALPLARVLSTRRVEQLRRAGLLGEVLLALPAGVGDAQRGAASAAARRAAFDPKLAALLPGPVAKGGSVARATASVGDRVEQGFGWTLVLTLLGLGGLSVWGSLRGRSLH